MSSLSVVEIIAGLVAMGFGILLIQNARKFPDIIDSIPSLLPWKLGRVFKPVPSPKRHPAFYVQNAYAGGAIFIAGGAYITISAILGWG